MSELRDFMRMHAAKAAEKMRQARSHSRDYVVDWERKQDPGLACLPLALSQVSEINVQFAET